MAVPAPRLISSSELEEFRPLIQIKRDRDTGKVFEVLDGLMLKDGYVYKKISPDSLSLWGVVPTEDELLKFGPSENNESNDLEWLSQLYGDKKKKRVIRPEKGGGGKGESSSGSGVGNGFELYDLVCFGKKDFGVIVGMDKDDIYKILKEGSDGPDAVTVDRHEIKSGLFDLKLTALDQHSKTILVNDTVRVLEGPTKGKQGIVKHIYRGIVFLYDGNEEENGGYLTCKSNKCEKVKLAVGDCSGKDSEPGPLVFEDQPSSPRSPLSPKKPWQARENNREFNRGDNNNMFTIGQTLRIRIGPLKGYICRVIALRRADVTVKLDSQQKVLTVKCEHLSEVQGKSTAISSSGDPDSSSSKPFDMLGTEGSSGGWLNGVGTSTGAGGWNAGGASSTGGSGWNAGGASATGGGGWNAGGASSTGGGGWNAGGASSTGGGGWNAGGASSTGGGGWNAGGPSSKRDAGSNHSAPSLLNTESTSNPFSSKGAEDSAWETKSNSNKTSSWGAAVDKTGIASDADQSGGWGSGGGSWGQAEHKTGSVGDGNQNSNWNTTKASEGESSGWNSIQKSNETSSAGWGGGNGFKSGSDEGNLNSTWSGWKSGSSGVKQAGNTAGTSDIDANQDAGWKNKPNKDGSESSGWETKNNWNAPVSSSNDKVEKGNDQGGWNAGKASGGSAVDFSQASGWKGGLSEHTQEGSNWGDKKFGSCDACGDSSGNQGSNGWGQKSNWNSGSRSGNETQNSHWSSGRNEPGNQDSNLDKKSNWNSGNSGNLASDPKSSNWNSGSGNSNENSNWGTNVNNKSSWGTGNENKNSSWSSGHSDPGNQDANQGKKSNWNSGNSGNQPSDPNSNWNSNKSSWSAGNENKKSNWSSGDPGNTDSNWGNKNNCISGSGDANQNTSWRSNSSWNTANASSDDGNEGSNENSDGVGGGNWRGGYRGRGGSDRGGFRGRGFRGRGERGGFGGRGEHGGFGGRGERGGFGGRGRSDREGFGGRWGSEGGRGGRGRGRNDQSGGWNNRRDSGEDGPSDWKKGADNGGWKNSNGSQAWNQDTGDKDRQSWSQGNADKEHPSWNQGSGRNQSWSSASGANDNGSQAWNQGNADKEHPSWNQAGNKQSWSSASGGGNNNWNNNGSSQTAEASWKKSTTEGTNIQGGGWNKGSSSNTTSKDETIQTLGCQCLSKFIYCQVDATYTHNIEKLVPKVCMLSREHGEACEKRCLSASSLQCLSAMVWFMAEFSHIFVDFDEIVRATLDNYEWSRQNEEADVRAEAHHNWVDEVIRCEGRGGSVIGNDNRSSCLIIQPRPEIKGPSLLTGEEIEKPEIWAQICIQRMVELAKESTTMRRVLDPMFVYFDSRQHWAAQKGLAMIILSRMAYFMENSGNQRLILASVIHHLDHKNVMNDPQLKTCVIQVATSLAMQIRSESGLAEIGFVGVLCRHLRKSLQASSEFVGEQELNLNISLQNSIDDCLLEIANGVIDAQPLFDLMAINLENIPSGVVGRATIGSLIILARAVTLALSHLHSQQGFPEALLVQLLKVMLHSDVEARVGAHLIFSILLFPSSFHTNEISSLRSRYLGQHNKRHSHAPSVSASASITALLEKLRRNRNTKAENHVNIVHDQERDIVAEDWKQGCGLKNSPNFYKLTSIIDKATGSPSLTDTEPYVMKLTEDQMAQLLSAFWIQANLPDNLPSNIEAIAHSFILTLPVLRIKNLKDRDSLVIRFFQLPLSLWTMLLDQSNGILSPACQRSVYVLSAGMLAFACKIYQIPDLNDVFASLPMSNVDPFLSISDDYRVYAKIHVDVREYDTAADNQFACSVLSELQNKIRECQSIIRDAMVHNLANITELDAGELAMLLLEKFKPGEEFVFGPQSMLDQNQIIFHSQESLSFDGDFPSNSAGEDDTISEASVSDLSRFIPKMPLSPSAPHVISIGQLMESALEVAGQVAGTAISTSPLPYNTMASQCESLGTCARKKLSNWLAFENHYSQALDDKSFLAIADIRNSAPEKVTNGGGHAQLPRDPMKLPPASPFDNFLKAAGC